MALLHGYDRHARLRAVLQERWVGAQQALRHFYRGARLTTLRDLDRLVDGSVEALVRGRRGAGWTTGGGRA